jgi:hypothetical protein
MDQKLIIILLIIAKYFKILIVWLVIVAKWLIEILDIQVKMITNLRFSSILMMEKF